MEKPSQSVVLNLVATAIWEAGRWVWGQINTPGGWFSMLIAILTTVWGKIEGLPSPALFVLFLFAFGACLIILNGIRNRKALTRWEQRTLEIEAKLPTLKAEVFITRQMLPVRKTVLIHQGSFVLLRIRNEPRDHNNLALAEALYAKISYCDEQWRELFPPTQGIWYSSESSTNDHVESLRPQHIAHLYISMKIPWEKSGVHHALDALHVHGIKFDRNESLPLLKNPRTYVKVILTCHLYRTAYYYLLTNDIGKEDLACEEIFPLGVAGVSRETNSTIP